MGLVVITSYIVFICVSCLWLFYVIRNTYLIILPGLKQLFMIFITHFCFMYIHLIHVLIRPAWQLNMASYFWDSQVLCHMYGRLGTFFGMVSLVLATLFGFCKVRVYVQFMDKPNCVCMQMRILSCILFLWIATCTLSVIRTNSNRHITNGVKLCFRYPDPWLVQTVAFLWFLINAYIMCFCIIKRNLLLEKFPDVSHQMRLNLYVIPGIFVSTFISRLIGWYYDSQHSDKQVGLFLRIMPVQMDNLLNNAVMYWFLYGNAKLDFLSRSETEAASLPGRLAVSKSRSRTPMQTPERHWVSLTGIHPVSMTLEEIFANDLQSLMVPTSMRRRQIGMFKNSWVELSKSSSRTVESDDDQETPTRYTLHYSSSKLRSQSYSERRLDTISTYSERRLEYEQKKEKKLNSERRQKTVLRIQNFFDKVSRNAETPELQLSSHSCTIEN